MTSAWGTALGLSLTLLSMSLVVSWLASLARSRSLGPNGVVGLKTAATKSSAEAWYAGHDAAGPALRATAVTAGVLAVATIGVAAGLGGSPHAPTVVTVAGLGSLLVVLALLLRATAIADRAARAVRRSLEGGRGTS